MVEKSVIAASNMETRSVALFVQTAGKYKSVVKVNMGSKHSNAKSIMGIISLGIMKDDQINLIIEGEDETEAMNALVGFLESENH